MKFRRLIPRFLLLATYTTWLAVVWVHGYAHTWASVCDHNHNTGTGSPRGIPGCAHPCSDPTHHRHSYPLNHTDRCLICESARLCYTLPSSQIVSLALIPEGIAIQVLALEQIETVDPIPIAIRGPPPLALS